MKKDQMHKNYSQDEATTLKYSGLAAELMKTVNNADERDGIRFDSADAASIYMARELDAVKSKTYDKEYPRLNALRLFPVATDTNPGANDITFYTYDMTGYAKITSDYSTDVPRADAIGESHTVPVFGITTSYGYSNQDLRAARMAGKPLDAKKAEAARFQNDNTVNRIAWAGDSTSGLLGILSTGQNIPVFTITAGATSGKTKWTEKTADEILYDVRGMFAQVSAQTKDVEHPDTLALPSNVYTALSMTRLGDTESSVLKFIRDNASDLKEIVSAAELNADSVETNPYAAVSGGSAVAVLYTNDSDKLEINIPLAFTQNPVERRGLEAVVTCESRCAGTIVFKPLSALIAVGI